MASRMNGKRRKLTAEFKTKVVLEALKEKMTLAELSQKYEVSGTQISTWKSDFFFFFHVTFGTKNDDENKVETETQRLYSKIGQLQMENDFLKKVLG